MRGCGARRAYGAAGIGVSVQRLGLADGVGAAAGVWGGSDFFCKVGVFLGEMERSGQVRG